jgi:hypothetical protein
MSFLEDIFDKPIFKNVLPQICNSKNCFFFIIIIIIINNVISLRNVEKLNPSTQEVYKSSHKMRKQKRAWI